ncbi:DNA/RNA helicase MER3/SLH1 [Klebsormidium nitens]|uniref:DNA/RNA helicase MER3/SLH1 n=1 Tax=Klebsormidium nitens TaxID=105231 RepID=A0A1Y1ID14_KLENI|nr:DNA/RNA helicase MER3/SLH1 [Klebsormidium nitens]|eukprot:GAQ86596.1 DNA/RNA helicase MER3/SLH1 [Klebsormidium nitens]
MMQFAFQLRYFNSVQSDTFREAYESDHNLVVAAPTGCGKTVLFELAILRLLTRFLDRDGAFVHQPGLLKTVYIAPMKALVQEKLAEWEEKFGGRLGLCCRELTGDSDIAQLKELQDADIILTTPEKFDSLTRKRNDSGGMSFFGDIALVLIDEVHLLNESRGAALEAIVSRLKMLARFGEEVRPVQLTTKVYGYPAARNDFLFEKMAGRAGRPQYDDTGTVVIMTRNETNPKHYGIEANVNEYQLEEKLKGICVENVHELAKYGLIEMDDDGFVLQPLEPGRLMARFYLSFTTMKLITQTEEAGDLRELLSILSSAEELSWIKLRRDEKKRLNDMNNDSSGRIRFHVEGPNGKPKKRIQTDPEKIFVLANDALSAEPSQLDFTLTQDVSGICSNGSRIARCMSEYFASKKRYKETVAALTLAKCLRQRMWEDSTNLLKQLHGVGTMTQRALLAAGFSTFEALEKADPRRLETITGRKYPFGNQLKQALQELPARVALDLHETDRHLLGQHEYLVTLTRISPPSQAGAQQWHSAALVVGSEQDNRLLAFEKISPYYFTVVANRNASGSPSNITATVILEDYDRSACEHACCKRNLDWTQSEWNGWQRSLWTSRGSSHAKTENLVPPVEPVPAKRNMSEAPLNSLFPPKRSRISSSNQDGPSSEQLPERTRTFSSTAKLFSRPSAHSDATLSARSAQPKVTALSSLRGAPSGSTSSAAAEPSGPSAAQSFAASMSKASSGKNRAPASGFSLRQNNAPLKRTANCEPGPEREEKAVWDSPPRKLEFQNRGSRLASTGDRSFCDEELCGPENQAGRAVTSRPPLGSFLNGAAHRKAPTWKMPDLRRKIAEESQPLSTLTFDSALTGARSRGGLAEGRNVTLADGAGMPSHSEGNGGGRSYGSETFLASGSSREKESFTDSFRSDFAGEIGEMAAALGFKSHSVKGSSTEPAVLTERESGTNAPVEHLGERRKEDVSPLMVEAPRKVGGVSEAIPAAIPERSSIFSFL